MKYLIITTIVLFSSLLKLHSQSGNILERVDSSIFDLHTELIINNINNAKKYANLQITFTNIDSIDVFLWLGNWRLILIRDKKDWFANIPTSNYWMNYLVIIDDSIKYEDITATFNSQIITFSGFEQKVSHLRPTEKFCLNVISTDIDLISFLQTKKAKLKIISTISKRVKINESNYSVLYKFKSLNILDLPVEKGPRINAEVHTLKTHYPIKPELHMMPKWKNNLFFNHFSDALKIN
ncbi:MAG: hypothetical protein AAFR87_11520 [Bacteroidota bacterium]